MLQYQLEIITYDGTKLFLQHINYYSVAYVLINSEFSVFLESYIIIITISFYQPLGCGKYGRKQSATIPAIFE